MSEKQDPSKVGSATPSPANNSEPEECPICKEEYGLGEDGINRIPYMIRCGHVYCYSCISSRFKMNPNDWSADCPLCRRTLIHAGPKCRHLCSYRPESKHPPIDISPELPALCIDCQVRDTLENMDDSTFDDADPEYKAERDSIRRGFLDVIRMEVEALDEGDRELWDGLDEELQRRTLRNQKNAVARLRVRLMKERW